MKIYLAPMEGITGYIYRNVWNMLFDGIDKFFTPFIATNQHGKLKGRELNEILPEHNREITVVPQILSNHGQQTVQLAEKLKEYGYHEININLGCPSGTVVSKGKGAGFLREIGKLDDYLEHIFSKLDMDISIKTRIGIENPDEFYSLIEIYNQYPLKELIIHPRLQTDYYKNYPNFDIFNDALKLSKNPICYNGDIFTEDAWKSLRIKFPMIDRIMLGRGILANPGLAGIIKGGTMPDKEAIKKFHDRLYEEYQNVIPGDRNVLFKMKEIWSYLITLFETPDKYAKKIRKAQSRNQYEYAVEELFCNRELAENPGYTKL